LDVLESAQEATAGGYRELALSVLQELRRRKKLPILTVGTGLYLRALLEGLADLPQRSEELRARLRASTEKHGDAHLHGLLKRLDTQSAQRIAAADTQKLMRAVEVCLLARRPLTEVHNEGRNPLTGWHIRKIGLQPAREELYVRIHARIDSMLAKGWQSEVSHLLSPRSSPDAADARRASAEAASLSLTGSGGSTGVAEAAKPFDFLGYRELAAVARKEMGLEEAREAIHRATRRYAKRQMTWFRREANVRWFQGFGDAAEVQAEALAWLEGDDRRASEPET
jgi:tRNA dimethylallyltransferase